MSVFRRVALGAVATALTGSALAAPQRVSAQQREPANPAASKDPADLAVDRARVDASAETTTVRLDARNLDIHGDGYPATNVELAASPRFVADDRVSRLEGWSDGGGWSARGADLGLLAVGSRAEAR